MNVATIILAAGGSTRLGGQAKQLLETDGTTLVRSMANMALSVQAGPVLVVLGANWETIEAELESTPVQIVHNPNWQDGLASSLRAGLESLTNNLKPLPSGEGLGWGFLVLLTDQPFVTADLLHQLLITQQQTGKGIVACRYGETWHLGVPALFAMHYKDAFMGLSGDVGARKLIQQHLDDCADVLFPLGAIDLDTPQDVKKWRDM